MSLAGISSVCSSVLARSRGLLAPWWPRAICAALFAAIGVMVGLDYYRMAAINRSLAAISEAGGMYARDDEAQGKPIVSIDVDSYLVDDTGHVHRRGRASDQVLALLPRFDQLRELSLVGADVTDAGLPHLTRLKALRRLSLRGTNVTDTGIAHLARCSRLSWIDLRETSVTSEAVGLLQRALPKTKILIDTE